MKSIFILFVVIITALTSTDAQDSIRTKPIKFKAKIDGAENKFRYISAFSDSILYLSSVPVNFSANASMKLVDRSVEYQNLQEVYIKRKGNAGRGFVKGLVIGAALGAIGGFTSAKDDGCSTVASSGALLVCWQSSTQAQKALGGGIFFGLTGGLFGTLVGALTGRNFDIGGDKEKFNALRNHITNKTIRSNQRKR